MDYVNKILATPSAQPSSTSVTSQNNAPKVSVCSNLANLKDLVGKSYKEGVPLLQLLSEADAAGNLKTADIVVLKNVVLTEWDQEGNYYEIPPHIELHGTINGAVHVGYYRGVLTPKHPNAAAIAIRKDKVSFKTYDTNKSCEAIPADQIIDMSALPKLSKDTEIAELKTQMALLNQRRNEALTLSIKTIGETCRNAPKNPHFVHATPENER